MIVVSSKPGGFFSSDDDGGAVKDGSTPRPDDIASYSLEDMIADPQVCRRVGGIISKGAQSRIPHPAAPANRSRGSTG
jgi:hypothetical protein